MVAVTKDAENKLEEIKKDISSAHMYFRDNYRRFHDFKTYVFKTTITEDQDGFLTGTERPHLEFNIVEAYLSRLLGEFAMHEPSITAHPEEGVPISPEVLEIVEGHIRHILQEANKHGFSYDIYKDALGGGFSAAKVWTDYANPMSFNQQIFVGKCFDATLVGFDPMARERSKADGRFSVEIYPMIEEDFKRKWPDVDIKTMGYETDVEGFNWTYKDDQQQRFILVADYYGKIKKRTKIVRLADGRVMTIKDYKLMQEYWEKEQFIEQIPAVVGNPRWTELEVVCCYKLVKNKVLEYYETDYTYLPHVFFDGNSEILTRGVGNCSYQMTRPYIYNARGTQDLKNFAGQCWANYLENLTQAKYIIMKEAIPQEQAYIDMITNIQKAGTIVVNAYSENNPEKAIPNPIQPVVNPPAPPEIIGAFQAADPVTQTILGSFASNLGKNDNDLSGKAVIESSTIGNAASMPYVVGHLCGLTQVANIIVDLIPKYLVGPRSIPIVKMNGEKYMQKINQKGYPTINYNEKAIHVVVEAGVNFQVQKTQALQQLTALMQASPGWAEFMNSEKGLKIISKNLTIYGAEELQEAVEEFTQQRAQQQQQAMQMQQQMAQQDPRMLKAKADIAKVQMQSQEMQMKQEQQAIENQLNVAKLSIEKELADAKILEAEAKVSQAQIDSAVRLEESQTSLEIHSLDAASKLAEIQSRHHDNAVKLHGAHLEERRLEHEINKATKEPKESKEIKEEE